MQLSKKKNSLSFFLNSWNVKQILNILKKKHNRHSLYNFEKSNYESRG